MPGTTSGPPGFSLQQECLHADLSLHLCLHVDGTAAAGSILDCVLIARCDVREIDLVLRMCELWWLVIWAVSGLVTWLLLGAASAVSVSALLLLPLLCIVSTSVSVEPRGIEGRAVFRRRRRFIADDRSARHFCAQ